MKLIDTKIITGTITLETGLHIGGAKATLDIGGLDSPVIKTPKGTPYIPGSSLKGKIRTLMALKTGSHEIKNDNFLIKKLFGYSGEGKAANGAELARFIFRDAMLDEVSFKQDFPEDCVVLETEYTEAKYENTINRTSGKADNPRQIERVPAGAKFKFEVVINTFDTDTEDLEAALKDGFKLLEKNYLGGSGTRGYGKVTIDFD